MNNFTWNFDKNITLEIAKYCIQEQFFKVNEIVHVGQGADNVVFLVNQKYIFRFARHAEMDAASVMENRVLAKLQNVISLQIPNPMYQGIPTQKFPFHFQGYEKLPGLSLYQSDLPEDQLKSCLQSFASFLKELHGVGVDQAQAWGLQKSLYDKTNIDLVVATLHERTAQIKDLNLVKIDHDALETEIDVAREMIVPQDVACLVHNDLDARHLLMNNGKLSGIIDWSDVDINHPVVDFSSVWAMFPKSMHESFFKTYGHIDENIWNYARILALIRSVRTLILFGYRMNDKKLLQAAIKSYEMCKQ